MHSRIKRIEVGFSMCVLFLGILFSSDLAAKQKHSLEIDVKSVKCCFGYGGQSCVILFQVIYLDFLVVWRDVLFTFYYYI